MGKNEGFLTPKAIAKGIKAKGLQKLRWYCQMCEKQCQDENGFKCHCMSESHQQQMDLFAHNPTRIIHGYSQEFENNFFDLLRRSSRRVAATVIYNEYIRDRHHVHMTSTKWATLTEFVEYLGRTGRCKVEGNPSEGWFITYIDRDSETERLKNKRARPLLADEEKQEREIRRQIEKFSEENDDAKYTPPKELKKLEEGVKVGFALGSKTSAKERGDQTSKLVFQEVEEKERKDVSVGRGGNSNSALVELMREEEKVKEKVNRKEYWLCEGIIVKVQIEKGLYDGRILQAVEYEDICKLS
ncbi:hypothetical protein Tsubulata_037701 [Turnera subulata]|uniref:DNA/RNA-binding protein Kin17 WH-like domain-containing protein n=1 Tax=Turnera subulata TaxID=218843 RepID=A0A9Q0FS57_9ROSI|nr:hypothetical protein Tsubulata_037701 [Turnera subulata]